MRSFKSESLSVLSPRDVAAIRAAALRTLEKVGVNVVDPAVRDLLLQAGATVQGKRVMLPEKVVIDAVGHAPRQFIVYDRQGNSLTSLDGFMRHSTAPSAINVIDINGEAHRSTYRDVANLTRLADSLPGLDFVSPPSIAQDCPESHSGVLTAEATFCNTRKFCLAFALDWPEADTWIAMARFAAGSLKTLGERPTIGFAISPTSPLVLGKVTSDILVGAAKLGLPIVTVPGGMAGGTGPYTIAGTLVVEHAEALLVVVVAQLVRPGTPCLLGLATALMDMGSGNVSLGKPERTLLLNAAAPLSRAWGLPGYAPAGLSDSFCLDEQAGGEKMLSLVTQLLSGIAFSGGAGRLEAGLSTSYEGVVIDHDLLQQARRFLRGIQVDPDTLAEDIIAGVGPAGSYLGEEHTLRYLRSGEFLESGVFNRRPKQSGGKTAADLAHSRVEEILATHPSPVPDTEKAGCKEIVADYLSRLDS